MALGHSRLTSMLSNHASQNVEAMLIYTQTKKSKKNGLKKIILVKEGDVQSYQRLWEPNSLLKWTLASQKNPPRIYSKHSVNSVKLAN